MKAYLKESLEEWLHVEMEGAVMFANEGALIDLMDFAEKNSLEVEGELKQEAEALIESMSNPLDDGDAMYQSMKDEQ